MWRISLLWYRMLTCWKCCSASSRVINERPVSLQVSPEKKKQTSTTATSVGNSWACQVCNKCVRESPVCMQCSVSQVCVQHLMCLHLTDLTEFLIKLDSLGIKIRQVISQVFNRALVVLAFFPPLLSGTLCGRGCTSPTLKHWNESTRFTFSKPASASIPDADLPVAWTFLIRILLSLCLHLGEVLCSNKLHLSHPWVLAIQWTWWLAVRYSTPSSQHNTDVCHY